MTDVATTSFLSATLIHRAGDRLQGLHSQWGDTASSSNNYCPGETEEIQENCHVGSLLSAQYQLRVIRVSAVLACHKTCF